MSPFDPSQEPARESKRVPLVREVVLEFDHFRGFIAEYSKNLSMGGMFIKSDTPKEPGEVFKFKFRLADGYHLIQGRGQVVWKREVDEGPDRPAGMGVRFLEIDEAGRQLIGKMVDEHEREGGSPTEFLADPADPTMPTRLDKEPWQLPAEPSQPEVPVRESSSPTLAEILQAPPLEPTSLEVPSLTSDALKEPGEPMLTPARSWSAAAAASKPGGRGRLMGIVLTLAVVVLAGLLFLNRERVMEILGQRSTGSSPPVLATGSEEEGESSGVQAPPSGPAAPEVDRAPVVGSPPKVEERAMRQESAEALPLERGSFTVIEQIEWRRERGGLVVELHADGVVGSADYDILELGEAGSPRVLLRLRGVGRAYPQSNIQVRTAEIRQIRTGYHLKAEGNELHVVFDLAGGKVRLSGVEDGGPILRLRFRAG